LCWQFWKIILYFRNKVIENGPYVQLQWHPSWQRYVRFCYCTWLWHSRYLVLRYLPFMFFLNTVNQPYFTHDSGDNAFWNILAEISTIYSIWWHRGNCFQNVNCFSDVKDAAEIEMQCITIFQNIFSTIRTPIHSADNFAIALKTNYIIFLHIFTWLFTPITGEQLPRYRRISCGKVINIQTFFNPIFHFCLPSFCLPSFLPASYSYSCNSFHMSRYFFFSLPFTVRAYMHALFFYFNFPITFTCSLLMSQSVFCITLPLFSIPFPSSLASSLLSPFVFPILLRDITLTQCYWCSSLQMAFSSQIFLLYMRPICEALPNALIAFGVRTSLVICTTVWIIIYGWMRWMFVSWTNVNWTPRFPSFFSQLAAPFAPWISFSYLPYFFLSIFHLSSHLFLSYPIFLLLSLFHLCFSFLLGPHTYYFVLPSYICFPSLLSCHSQRNS
jgi:hypothetical protein